MIFLKAKLLIGTGCVGEGMAVKFMAHKKVAGDLTVPEDVLDAKVKRIDNTEVSACYALATNLCYELRDRHIAGEKAGADSKQMALYHKSYSNFISFMMDNFETEMVIMASRVAMQQYKLMPSKTKLNDLRSTSRDMVSSYLTTKLREGESVDLSLYSPRERTNIRFYGLDCKDWTPADVADFKRSWAQNPTCNN